MTSGAYKRVLLKLSGEALMGKANFGIDTQALISIASQIQTVTSGGLQMAIVVGGGNIWRGSTAEANGMDRVTADYIGMLATVMNALALQHALEKREVTSRTQSAINIQAVAEPYIRRRAVRHLEKGRVVIFAAGTGNPYMTTDSAAALRAIEIGAQVLLMAKNAIDGVYDSNPAMNPQAKKFDFLTYSQAISLRLQVMDTTALSLCQENNLPIIVFDLQAPRGIERVVKGEKLGTIIRGD